jgi:hypothetical protein
MTAAPDGVTAAVWRAVLAEDVPPPGQEGREMTAAPFDAEAIARRVFDAEHAAVDEPHEPAPARPHDPYLPGTGQTRGRPLPTIAEGDGSDIFDRLERQREAKRVHSPIVLRDAPFEPTARTRAERAAVEEQYVAPPLVEDDDPADLKLPHGPNCQEYGCTLHAEPAPVEPTHDPRCGEQLTGGGAPRGWVLVRIVGSGAPRRYCGTHCAVAALGGPTGSWQVPLKPDQVAELERRYAAGEATAAIAAAIGCGTATVTRYAAAAAAAGRLTKRTKGSSAVLAAQRLRQHGLTSIQVKRWAVETGLLPQIAKASVAHHVIDAYLAAHQNGAQQ